jgi:uncharacterized protein (UPF0332 family)
MARREPKILHLIAESSQDALALMKQARGIETKTACTIEQLVAHAVADRLALAKAHLSSATVLAGAADYRGALGRAYYSMYNTFRAVVFFEVEGDDFEGHSVLPDHIPQTFPSRPRWNADLKEARLERNKADYDAYPRGTRIYKKKAEKFVQLAGDLLPVARRYLRGKGWTT